MVIYIHLQFFNNFGYSIKKKNKIIILIINTDKQIINNKYR
jgi:hypothetical protein